MKIGIPQSPVIILGEILAILLVITGLTLLIRHWIKKNKEAKLEEKGTELGGIVSGGSTEKSAEEIRKMTAAEREKYLKSMHATDYVGIGEAIWDAKGTIYDNPEDVYAALARIPSKAVLISFQTYFKEYYKRDLMSFLASFLSLAEQGKVYDILKKLK